MKVTETKLVFVFLMAHNSVAPLQAWRGIVGLAQARGEDTVEIVFNVNDNNKHSCKQNQHY